MRTVIMISILMTTPVLVLAQQSYDCTTLSIEDVDKTKLTKQELLALEEQSLFASVEGYSACMGQAQAEAANAVGAGARQGASEPGGEASSANSEEGKALSSESETQKSSPSGGAENQVIAPKDNDSIVCKILYEEIGNETDDLKKAGLRKQYKDYSCG
jgi:hypothetical protein